MQIKKLAVLVALVLALGGSGLVALAAFNTAPVPADILTRAVTNLTNAQDGHAVLQIQGTSPDKSGTATVEVWAKKLADGKNYALRAEVRDSSEAQYRGAIAVSNGTDFWAYLPISNTVWTGPVNSTQQGQDKSPQELVQQLLDYSTVTLSGVESVNGNLAYKLQLVPNDKAPKAAAGATGLVWIDQTSYLPWKGTVDAGSMGRGQFTAQVLELNIGVPDSRFQFQPPAGARIVPVQNQQPQHLTLNEADKTAGFKLLKPGYLPAGATLVDVLKAGKGIVYRYESAHGSFSIEQSAELQGKSPATSGEAVQVRGVTATLFASPDGSRLMLMWTENGRRYSVSGAISRQEALKVAESLQ
ncbi:MAG: DUF4367 domain-containing protein [Anaerolineae bacterium]